MHIVNKTFYKNRKCKSAMFNFFQWLILVDEQYLVQNEESTEQNRRKHRNLLLHHSEIITAAMFLPDNVKAFTTILKQKIDHIFVTF